MDFLELCFDFFSVFGGYKFKLKELNDRIFNTCAEFFFIVEFGDYKLIFFLEMHDGHFVLFVFLFTLNKVIIALISSFEDIVLENNELMRRLVIFLKFMKIIHIELNKEKITCRIKEGKLLCLKY